jgi:hypothetical protein
MSTISSLDAFARRRAAGPATPILTERAAALAQALVRMRRARRGIDTGAVPLSGPMFDLKFALTLERSRRCERPFAISRFVAGDGVGGRAWTEWFVAAAARHVRTCDAVGLVDGHPVVVWDESDRPGAGVAAKRLAEAVGIDAEVAATVVFPDDGYTPSALFRALDASHVGSSEKAHR